MEWDRANKIASYLRDYGIKTAVYTFDERTPNTWGVMCWGKDGQPDLYITSAVATNYRSGDNDG